MSREKRNVLSESAEALNRIADSLEELNTILYAIGAELICGKDDILELFEQLKIKLSEPLKVVVDFESFKHNLEKVKPKPEKAEVPKEAFPTL